MFSLSHQYCNSFSKLAIFSSILSGEDVLLFLSGNGDDDDGDDGDDDGNAKFLLKKFAVLPGWWRTILH